MIEVSYIFIIFILKFAAFFVLTLHSFLSYYFYLFQLNVLLNLFVNRWKNYQNANIRTT